MQKNKKEVVALSHQPCNLTMKRLIGAFLEEKCCPKLTSKQLLRIILTISLDYDPTLTEEQFCKDLSQQRESRKVADRDCKCWSIKNCKGTHPKHLKVSEACPMYKRLEWPPKRKKTLLEAVK